MMMIITSMPMMKQLENWSHKNSDSVYDQGSDIDVAPFFLIDFVKTIICCVCPTGKTFMELTSKHVVSVSCGCACKLYYLHASENTQPCEEEQKYSALQEEQ